MRANTKKTFADCLDGLEEISATADMLVPHVSLQSISAQELVSSVTPESIEPNGSAIQIRKPSLEVMVNSEHCFRTSIPVTVAEPR